MLNMLKSHKGKISDATIVTVTGSALNPLQQALLVVCDRNVYLCHICSEIVAGPDMKYRFSNNHVDWRGLSDPKPPS